MGINKTLFLGLGAMIFGGCYSGVEDAGDEGISDRYGRHCYSSYSSDRSARFKSSASPSSGRGGASSMKTDDGFMLTMKAEPVSSPEQLLEVLDQLRFQAASTSQFFIQTACGGKDGIDQLVDNCKDTCAQQGLAMDDVVLCDPECKDVGDGIIECHGGLPAGAEEALSKPWTGEKEWVFQTGEGTTLVMTPPELEEGVEDGKDGMYWVSQVQVTGFCLCACSVG